MSDLIKRSDAIKVVSHVAMECIDRKTRIELINAIPSADSTEYKRGKADEKRWWSEHCAKCTDADRPQGEWIYGEHDVAMCDGYRCDRCGFFVPWDYEHKSIDFISDYNFCPNCGARMKGAGDE